MENAPQEHFFAGFLGFAGGGSGKALLFSRAGPGPGSLTDVSLL
jgi:hypothetical protein